MSPDYNLTGRLREVYLTLFLIFIFFLSLFDSETSELLTDLLGFVPQPNLLVTGYGDSLSPKRIVPNLTIVAPACIARW
ncbi:hypothetical protein NUACC26_026220 [Scytonema sp. NUACC26]